MGIADSLTGAGTGAAAGTSVGGFPWGTVIGAGAGLIGSWLNYRGSNRATDAQEEANERATEEARRQFALNMLMRNRMNERSLGMLGARYANRYPLLSRVPGNWLTPDQYMGRIRGSFPMWSDEDMNYMMKHGEISPPSRRA